MTDETLALLARRAGIGGSWKDVFGKTHDVAPPTLRAVLAALDLPAGSDAQIEESFGILRDQSAQLAPLITATVGETVAIPAHQARYHLLLEDGRSFDGISEESGTGARIPPILEAGFHSLEHGGARIGVAVAPRRCFTVEEALGGRPGWGVAVQLYALRRPGDAGIGDLAALAAFARNAASAGADAVAISPLHAQFSADPDRFSPYAPSSRTALNVLHNILTPASVEDAAVRDEWARLEALALVDWPMASRMRLARLARMYRGSLDDPAECAAFASFRAARGEALGTHALFEALHAHLFGQDPSLWHWRSWPAALRDPHSKEVAAFAQAHADEVSLHFYLQFLADRGLADAQAASREAGMRIGLISDLAVGTDSGGSQCWSRQQETLLGLSVGAPPDLLQRRGQNWGLTAFSPRGLVQNGFATYRDMLDTALAHSGGMRIDHAMGLNRLWVIPDGADGADGAYLSFPERDLLRLVTLGSHRRRAVVLAEDLGTVPEGFSERLRDAGISGLRVLWFERDEAERFTPPGHWTRHAAAMTSTHDLPTVAGWWCGRDIDWRERLGHGDDEAADRETRSLDRARLWDAMVAGGAAHGEQPAAQDGAAVADAACAHVGASACDLVMLPVEDALALVEQPNLPGTLDEHPNWRRRLPGEAATQLDDPRTRSRLALLDLARREIVR